jgi:outer membrane protein TolC
VNVQQQALDLAQKQLADDKQRVQIKVMAELGGTIEQDEAQVAQSRASLISAQFGVVSAQNALKNLITDNYRQWHDVEIVPSASMEAVREFFDLQSSWSRGMTQRPDLIQAKIDAEQQGIQLKYSYNQLFPELDLTGSYGFSGAGQEFSDSLGQVRAGNRPYYSYGFLFSIPLSNARARNGYKTAQATQQQVVLRLKQLEQNVMVQIDDAVKQAQSAWESLEATRSARVSAEAALKAEQGKYNAGKSTTFTVLQLQNRVTSARSQEIRSVANYNEALTRLALQEGSTLERRQIDFKVK